MYLSPEEQAVVAQVQEFLRGLAQLTKDTGVKVTSFLGETGGLEVAGRNDFRNLCWCATSGDGTYEVQWMRVPGGKVTLDTDWGKCHKCPVWIYPNSWDK